MAVNLRLRELSGEVFLEFQDMSDSVGMGFHVGDTIAVGPAISLDTAAYKVLNRTIQPNTGVTIVTLDVVQVE